MRIVVLIKQVPVVTAMRFDPGSKRLQREGVPAEISSFDVRALVRAVELKAETGAEVVALTMGPPPAREALVECLALGADRAVHLVDRAFAGADTLATARALAAALRREPFDLVLCGRNSVDAETGQVGPEVAELLDLPQVTAAHRLEVDAAARRLRAERETDDGYETVEAPLPVLVTAAEDLAEERFPTKAAREQAAGRPIVEVDAAALGGDPQTYGAAGSPTEVTGIETVESRREGKIVEAASVGEAVAALVAELDARGLLAAGAPRGDRLPAAPVRPNTPTGPGYWVVAEMLGGDVRPVTFELIGAAGELAAKRGGHVAALLLGGPGFAGHGNVLAAHGADIIYVAEDPALEPYTTEAHTAVLASAIAMRRPAAVLFGSTAIGRDLAPRVAARLGLGLTGDCIDLGLADDGRLVQYKPAFGGNVVAPILSRTTPDLATVRPGMLAAREPHRTRRAPWERLAVGALPAPRVRVVARAQAEASGAAALDTAAIIVGVGKGVGGPDGLPAVRELAAALGAALGATREVTDLGWLPRQHQIGLTGRAVAPRLYVALGVSGAAEHLVGVRRAGLVVAVNKNPKAAIFKHADRGLVADWAEAVAALGAALRARRGGAAD